MNRASDGAWTVYPFLPSGNVIITGMNQGLYIVDPTFDDELEPAA